MRLAAFALQIGGLRNEVEVRFRRSRKLKPKGRRQAQLPVTGSAQPHAEQQLADRVGSFLMHSGVSIKHLGCYGIDHPEKPPICRHSFLLEEILWVQNVEKAAPRGAKEILPAWGAVVSMGLGVFGLVGAELLPASLLTPMAWELGITEGLAGQAVTATAVIGFMTGLTVTAITRRIDRRLVLLGFSLLLVFSNLLVAVAPNLPTLLAGRMLLRIALGGFWTLSAAVIMRLVPERLVPTASIRCRVSRRRITQLRSGVISGQRTDGEWFSGGRGAGPAGFLFSCSRFLLSRREVRRVSAPCSRFSPDGMSVGRCLPSC